MIIVLKKGTGKGEGRRDGGAGEGRSLSWKVEGACDSIDCVP